MNKYEIDKELKGKLFTQKIITNQYVFFAKMKE
jgi:hypothetical protein